MKWVLLVVLNQVWTVFTQKAAGDRHGALASRNTSEPLENYSSDMGLSI